MCLLPTACSERKVGDCADVIPYLPCLPTPSLVYRCDAASNARCCGRLRRQADPRTARQRRGQAARCGGHPEGLHDAEAQVCGVGRGGGDVAAILRAYTRLKHKWGGRGGWEGGGNSGGQQVGVEGEGPSHVPVTLLPEVLICLTTPLRCAALWSSRSFCERSPTSWSSRWPRTTSGWLPRNAAAVVTQPEAGRQRQQRIPHCLHCLQWERIWHLVARPLLLLLLRRRRRRSSSCKPSQGPGAGN